MQRTSNDQPTVGPGLIDPRFSRLGTNVDLRRPIWSSFLNALLAMTCVRSYHITLFFTAWGTLVTLVNQRKIYELNFQPTLLTVIGMIIGFVISYRTTSSFERYNEGRRLWSQIVFQSRTFARTVWFHVPIVPVKPEAVGRSAEELKARDLVEKKTVVNLIEAFAVAVKHHLRYEEEGIYYEDLYPLVKYLTGHSLPTVFPSTGPPGFEAEQDAEDPDSGTTCYSLVSQMSPSATHLPLHHSSSVEQPPSYGLISPSTTAGSHGQPSPASLVPSKAQQSNCSSEEPPLLPSRMPLPFYYDIFPFSWFANLKRQKDARSRTNNSPRKRGRIDTHNVPLEITLYLSSYIATLQRRQVLDVPTASLLLASLNGLVDALTELERILTTPIPFSYSVHLWVVTTLYCLALPLQIWQTMTWLTIPATSILSLIFFGFLVAGEEIENPFGYDKNDLDMDHFTHSIIRPELMAITSLPTPEIDDWVFSPQNDVLFDVHNFKTDKNANRVIKKVTPDEWVSRGSAEILQALRTSIERAGMT